MVLLVLSPSLAAAQDAGIDAGMPPGALDGGLGDAGAAALDGGLGGPESTLDSPPGIPARSPRHVALPDGTWLDVGCPVREARVVEESMYAICDDGQLVWIDWARRWIEPISIRARAVGLFVHDGALWVELETREAIAIDALRVGSLASRPAGARAAVRPRRQEPDVFEAYSLAPPAPRPAPEPAPEISGLEGRLVGVAIAAAMRPFVDDDGGGAVGQLDVRVGFAIPLFVVGALSPIGFGSSGADSHGIFAASLVAGYDHDDFRVGAGGGVVYVDLTERDRHARGMSPTVLALARFGGEDGANVTASGSIAVIDGEVSFGSVDASIQIPVGRRAWMLFEGGGGVSGILYGGVAARVWVSRASNGRGVFLLPGLGAAGIARDRGSIGPSIKIGVEVRP